MINLHKYFDEQKGYGILATADSNGKVDIALYSRPHIMAEDTIAFIMPDRLTRHNLQSNPHAAYVYRKERKIFRHSLISQENKRRKGHRTALFSSKKILP